MSQIDKTPLIGDFERTAFNTSKRLFYIPSVQFLTLDDELMGTRSQQNPVTYISIMKADLEGQSADVISDAIFRFSIETHLHRRPEIHSMAVKNVLENFQDGRGEISTWSTILTADRGYGNPTIVDLVE